MTDKDLKKIGNLMDEKLVASEKRVANDIGDFIDQFLLPQLTDKADKTDINRLETDINRLERKLDRALDKDIEQDNRLNRIEAIPVVALQLSSKKSSRK